MLIVIGSYQLLPLRGTLVGVAAMREHHQIAHPTYEQLFPKITVWDTPR